MFVAEGNLTIKASPICMFSQTVRYTNPNRKGKFPHIVRITSMVLNEEITLIIDQDEVLSRVLLPMMQISITLGYSYLHSLRMKYLLHFIQELSNKVWVCALYLLMSFLSFFPSYIYVSISYRGTRKIGRASCSTI